MDAVFLLLQQTKQTMRKPASSYSGPKASGVDCFTSVSVASLDIFFLLFMFLLDACHVNADSGFQYSGYLI